LRTQVRPAADRMMAPPAGRAAPGDPAPVDRQRVIEPSRLLHRRFTMDR
jgi:hypothetical protein